eukprot:3644587-Rhodomonas_salina.3
MAVNKYDQVHPTPYLRSRASVATVVPMGSIALPVLQQRRRYYARGANGKVRQYRGTASRFGGTSVLLAGCGGTAVLTVHMAVPGCGSAGAASGAASAGRGGGFDARARDGDG